MMQKIANLRLAAFSVGYSTRPEFKLRSNSSSPLKWTEILVASVFIALLVCIKYSRGTALPCPYKQGLLHSIENRYSPLERTFAMSQGFKPLAGAWVGAR